MRILVCPPRFFGVEYIINPWMEGQIGRVDPVRAHAQWAALVEAFSACATIEEVPPREGEPAAAYDLEFIEVEDRLPDDVLRARQQKEAADG